MQQAALRFGGDDLLVAKVDRTGERIDLGARIVDVIFAVHGKTGLGEQRRQRIADNSAAAVTDMHWPCGIGRDEFDIDPLAAAGRRIAVSGAGLQNRAQLCVPHRRFQPDIEKARACRRGQKAGAAVVAGLELAAGQCRGDPLGQGHRVLLDRAGQHHRRIGREIAMRRIARRLDRDPGEIEPGRQRALGNEAIKRGQKKAAKIAVNIDHNNRVMPSLRYRTTGDARRGRIGRSCRRGNRRRGAPAPRRCRRSARAIRPAAGRARRGTGETAR